MAEFGQIGEAFVDIRANFGTFQSDLAGAQKKLGRNLQAIGGGFKSAGRGLTLGLTVPILAAAGAAIKFGSDFESGFAGVRKTVNATEAEFAGLSKGFRQLSKDTGTSIVEILGVGEAAGQLGIQTKNILGFTKVMADLGVTTNLSSQEAATALARLANITGLPQDQFDRLGSTIVDLGNNLATTEAEIVNFGLRLAGAGKQIGLSEAEILAFGAALSSVGVRAEAGGTALSKTFIKISKAVASGGEQLELFAGVAGQSTEQFAEAFEKDAAGSVLTFIEGLKRLSDEGVNIFGVLEDLELQDIRLSDALLRTAGAGDLVRRSLEIGTKAFKENTALVKEAAQRYATFESQVAMLGEEFKDIGVTVFSALRPVLVNQVIPLIKDVLLFVASLAEGFARLPAPVQTTIIAFTALLAALGPIVIIIGTVISSLGTIALVFGGLAGGAAAGGAGVLSFGAIMAGLLPVLASVAVALGVVTLAAVAIFAGVKLGDAIAQFLTIDEQLNQIAQDVSSNVLGAFNKLKKAAADVKFPPEFSEELDSLFAQFQDTGDLEEFRSGLNRVGLAMRDVEVATAKTVVELEKNIETQEELDIKQRKSAESAKKLAEAAKALAEQQKAAADATQNALQPFKGLVEQWNLAKEAGISATEFTAAFSSEIEAAGLRAEGSARLFDALGIEVKNLPPELREAADALRAVQTQIDNTNISILALEQGIVPLGLATGDFAKRLESLTGPELVASQNAQRLQDAFDDLQQETKDAEKEIKDLEQEITDYEKVGASAEQITEKFGKRIEDTKKKAKLFGIELGKSTRLVEKDLKAKKENADFAKKFSKEWSTAVGTMFGNFLTSLTNMEFSFSRFGKNIVDTLKGLGKTLLGTFASAFFSPILKAGQRFAENLADTIFSAFTGGEGPAGGLLGGIGGGGGFDFTKGLGGIGQSIKGAFAKALPFLTNPITLAVAGIGAAVFGIFKAFTQTPLEAGVKEVTRDFGVRVTQDTLEGFTQGLGLTEEKFKPIRKDILASPEAFKNLLLPAAEATGSVDALVASFGKLEAFGQVFDLSAEAAKAAGGDFEDFNKRFLEIFGGSEALVAQFGADLGGLLVDVPGAEVDPVTGEPVVRTGELLGDIFVDRLDTLIETFGAGFELLAEKLTEIVDRLTALISPETQVAQLEAGGLDGANFNITIQAMDSESMRQFFAGDGGDAFIEELILRRAEQITEIVKSAEKSVEE